MRILYALLTFLVSISLAFGTTPEKKETSDYVSLRISARVIGQYTGRYSETLEDLSKSKTYLDAYATSYTSVTKWKVKDLDQPDDVASLELVSDKPQDESDKRLTGKFDPEKPFAVSGTSVYNASEIPSFKALCFLCPGLELRAHWHRRRDCSLQ
jgi:hypothetical protein